MSQPAQAKNPAPRAEATPAQIGLIHSVYHAGNALAAITSITTRVHLPFYTPLRTDRPSGKSIASKTLVRVATCDQADVRACCQCRCGTAIRAYEC